MICTFIGNSRIAEDIEKILTDVIRNLIEKEKIHTFYVGNHGTFDRLVRKVLKALKNQYTYIEYAVVLAYPPKKQDEFSNEDYSDTIYPEGLERVPLKFAIIKRNYWMIDRSDTVITYVKNIAGNSRNFKEYAEKKGKRIIELKTQVQN